MCYVASSLLLVGGPLMVLCLYCRSLMLSIPAEPTFPRLSFRRRSLRWETFLKFSFWPRHDFSSVEWLGVPLSKPVHYFFVDVQGEGCYHHHHVRIPLCLRWRQVHWLRPYIRYHRGCQEVRAQVPSCQSKCLCRILYYLIVIFTHFCLCTLGWPCQG